jgi:phage FluMu gp28-like protein
MSSYSNPFIPASELDSLKVLMPERAFSQEILAQFLEDGGGVFRKVRDASTLTKQEPTTGSQYVIGVDWGRSNDSTVFSVLEVASKHQVYMDRMSDTDYATQRLRLKALAERYNNAYIIAEANSMGQPNIEALQNMGCSVQAFVTTNATKANIIQGLELAFERSEIALLNDEYQITELMAYQSEKLPSGLIRYGSPEGLHDDTVMALAMAWSSISGPRADTLIDFA